MRLRCRSENSRSFILFPLLSVMRISAGLNSLSLKLAKLGSRRTNLADPKLESFSLTPLFHLPYVTPN
jgi:hypothetical protein